MARSRLKNRLMSVIFLLGLACIFSACPFSTAVALDGASANKLENTQLQAQGAMPAPGATEESDATKEFSDSSQPDYESENDLVSDDEDLTDKPGADKDTAKGSEADGADGKKTNELPKEEAIFEQAETANAGKGQISESAEPSAKSDSPIELSQPMTAAAAVNTGKGDLAPGKYFIVSALNTTKVVDVCGASKGNGANVIAWSGSGNANQQWSIALDKEGYAILTSVNSGKVLDVEGARGRNGANVIQYQANNGKNQKWIIKKYNDAYLLISALNNNLVLDLTGNRANDGTNVEIWTRNNGKNQLFRFVAVAPVQATPGTQVLPDGVYTVKAASASNTAVDVAGGTTANGGNVLTWSPSGAAWQAWYLAYDMKGYYTITSVNSGRQLAPAAAYSLNGINVGQYSLGNADLAKWIITSVGSGQYALVNKATGTYLNVASVAKNNSGNIQMGADSQKFTLSAQTVIPSGAVVIEAAANTHLALDVYNNSVAKNAKLGTYTSNGGLNQRFLVTQANGGYTIRPFNSRMYLTASSSGVLIQEPARANMQNQIWKINASQGLVTFVNASTGKAIAISGNAAKASATITTTSAANNSTPQRFYMRAVAAVSNGTYYIGLSSNQSTVFDVQGANRKDMANVELWQKNNGNNQKFTITGLGGGLYKISNVATGRVFDVTGASTKAGANVEMYKWNGGNNQKWKIEFNSDFSLKITNAQTGFSLDTAKSSTAKGANVIVNTVNGKSATQKIWITDAAKSAEIVQIGVPCYLQNPELPTGCESVALTNALRYWGYGLSKTTIADAYMPYGDNGVYNFIGNPRNYSGWIICAPGITNTAKSYISRNGGTVVARNVTGTPLSSLRGYLDKGQPVIVWTTIDMEEPGGVEWYSDGYPLRSHNHTVVLTGYNPFNGDYQVADSLAGTVWRNGGAFERLYNLMGKQAVVLEN